MAASTSTAIIPHDGRPTAAVKAVASQLVSDGTKATYTQENLIFVIYLYDTDADNFIWDQVLDAFHKAHKKDQEEERTKKSRRNL